jgi:hypothetical protein
MRNWRLKASISSRFTGPSHLASLAESTTAPIAKSWSRRPNSAATRAGLRTKSENPMRMFGIAPLSAAWPRAAPTTAPNGPPIANPATPPMILPQ